MIRIDMTEEPEDELDLIFKAQNIFTYDDYKLLLYLIPMENEYGQTQYVTKDFYDMYKDNFN